MKGYMIMAKLLVGKEAETVLTMILKGKIAAVSSGKDNYGTGRYPAPYVSGYYKGDNQSLFTAFDNSDGNCWVEDFKIEAEAKQFATVDLRV